MAALLLFSSSAFAAAYQRTDLTFVDPIQDNLGGNHPYLGIDLEPSANLSNANLFNANLTDANLTDANLASAILFDTNLVDADLAGANLGGANLGGANLSGANLTGVTLIFATLFGADLTGATLVSASGLGQTFGNASTLYDVNTIFTGTFFDPVAAGWTLVPVPEPGTAILMGLGLAWLAAERR